MRIPSQLSAYIAYYPGGEGVISTPGNKIETSVRRTNREYILSAKGSWVGVLCSNPPDMSFVQWRVSKSKQY